ncbi:MAG: DUF2339 domain-containing protein [Burkholderiales bacterium]|nr:DUF2339 domain-containing protein [Burkholderiales bacterium]
MAIVIGLVVGILVGAVSLGVGGAFAGALIGAIVGLIVRSRPGKPPQAVARPVSTAAWPLADRVNALERRVAELERALAKAEPAAAAASLEPQPTPAAVPPEVVVPPVVPPVEAQTVAPVPEPAPVVAPPPHVPAPPEPAPNPIWAWIVGGNTLARVGVVLLFIGVGFLLKFAVERVSIPVSVRLAGVAAGAIVMLAIGWRLREHRRAYAMVLQGGAVGILYLTVFAALRVWALLPPALTFGLLVWMCAVSSFLAIRQDALVLAVLAVAGGFLAPILTSSQAGNHVLLFSYYLLLNAGILGIAWFKAWRLLNVLGFAFTFIVGTVWGVTRYRPEHFATTEPFLVLFFLFYVAIAVLYALRRRMEVRDYLDAALVFGTPLVAAGLQSALVRHIEYAMAWSALAMAALYLVLARVLYARRRDDLRLLVESFLALGIGFATLAIPLALDARWTSAAWAIEGAAMVWVGVRQQRLLARVAGCLLEVGAGIAFASGLSPWAPAAAPVPYAIVNSAFLGAVLIALAGLYTARLLDRAGDRLAWAAPVAFGWGTLWWLYAAVREIDRFAPTKYQPAALVLLLAATAVAFALVEARLRWPRARFPALALLPLLFVGVLILMLDKGMSRDSLLGNGGFIAWSVAVAVIVALLRTYERPREGVPALGASVAAAWHAGLFWLVLLIVTHDVSWAGARIARNGAWSAAAWGLVPALFVVAACRLAQGSAWPVAAHRKAYLVIAIAPVSVLLALWSVGASVLGAGDPAPLPYIPLVNPLDLTQAIVLVALATWALMARRDDPAFAAAVPHGAVIAVLCVLGFLWINAIALRTLHFAYDIAYTPGALWRSTLVQAVLSLLWSAVALATMAIATRRQWRAAWIAGAVLLGVVVVKLFVVELAQTGTITRIVSFIGVGLLLLLVGYLAPVPPRRKEDPA